MPRGNPVKKSNHLIIYFLYNKYYTFLHFCIATILEYLFMMPYLFEIFGFQVRIYSLMYILAIVIAIYFSRKRAIILGYKPQELENIVVTLFIFGLLGARLYYVFSNWDYYSHYPLDILAVWKGGLAIHGGVIGAVIGAFLYSKFTKISAFFILDMVAPFALLGQGVGRFGNFANGEAHGVPVITPPEIIFKLKPIFTDFWYQALYQLKIPNNPSALSELQNKIAMGEEFAVNFQGKEYILKEYVPWGISFPATYMPPAFIDFGTLAVHPTFFYEMIFNFIGAAILLYLWKQNKYIATGLILGMYLVFYGVIRSFVTVFRADDLMLAGFRMPHITGLIFILVGLFFVFNAKKRIKNNEER